MTFRDYRKRKKLNQYKLAELVGVKQGAISCYERGERVPSLKVALKLADVLECPIDILVNGVEGGKHNDRDHCDAG